MRIATAVEQPRVFPRQHCEIGRELAGRVEARYARARGYRDGRSVDSCVGYFRGLRNRALRVAARAAVCEAVSRAISPAPR